MMDWVKLLKAGEPVCTPHKFLHQHRAWPDRGFPRCFGTLA
jgi:hypothetical protein